MSSDFLVGFDEKSNLCGHAGEWAYVCFVCKRTTSSKRSGLLLVEVKGYLWSTCLKIVKQYLKKGSLIFGYLPKAGK